jgi:hypothetical protein
MSLQNALPTERHRLDVAISAVSYDALLVTDLSTRLAQQLSTPPTWYSRAADLRPDGEADAANAALLGESARVVVVLHQRLWGHDETTAADADALRERIRAKQHKSIRVVALDDEPIPSWLKTANHCVLNEVGVDGVVQSVVAAVAAYGGNVGAAPIAPEEEPAKPRPAWSEPPVTFMSQPRALTALRHEFETLTAQLAEHVKFESNRLGDVQAELHTAPQRLVVQIGSVALTMSWVAGRSGKIVDGRLMVIEWTGAVAHRRQMGGLQTASLMREQSYRPEAKGPDDWCWRPEGAEGVAYSSKNLAGQCFSATALARPATAATA